MSAIDQQKLLESLIVDNDNLEKLEDMIAEFNIFETLRIVRHEERHSDMLAFLLNPRGKHGLTDYFLKQFIVDVLKTADNNALANDIRSLDLQNAIVERESHRIDILIHDTSNKLVCIIENKIDTGEHSNQLERYLVAVRHRFGEDIQYFIPIFLSPHGTPPEAENSPYLPISYQLIHDTLETVRLAYQAQLQPSVNIMMEHYTTMLRRHIMTDSEIADLCRKIYSEHREALDLIFQYRLDDREIIAQTIADIISADERFIIRHAEKDGVQFYPKAWLDIPALQTANNVWRGKPNLLVRFFFPLDATNNRLRWVLRVGPGDNTVIRQKLIDLISQQPYGLNTPRIGDVVTVYRKTVTKDYLESGYDNLAEKWQEFVTGDFVRIHQTILDANFE